MAKQTGCSFSSALTQAWERYRNFKAQKVEELTKQIADFDFAYPYSDDSRVYRYWSKIQDELRNQLSTLPGSFVSAITGQLSNSKQIQSFI